MLSVPVATAPYGLGEPDGSPRPIPLPRISALKVEHDDLDCAIDALVSANTHDDLIVARLKKRRLQICDEIASIGAADQTQAAPNEAEFQSDVDIDAFKAHTLSLVGPAPGPNGASFVFGVLATLTILLILGLGWSGLDDSLNQTVAQIYLLSLLVAANG
jgi:hypothetical protein